MAKAGIELERYELELTALVVGCRHQEFDQDAVFDEVPKIKLRPEPDNPVDPNAIVVLLKGEICGRIAKEHLESVSKFRKALETMEPYLQEYNSGAEVGEVVKEADGRIQKFVLGLYAVADVPAEVADALDRIQC